MMKQMVVLSAVTLVVLATPALADPTFYVAANPYSGWSSTLDVPWQTAVGYFIEHDLDNFANHADIDALAFDSIVADVGLGGLGGTASTAEIFDGSWGGAARGSVYGTVYENGLLNRDAAGSTHGDIVFEFSTPVAGFGAWVYDNCGSSTESFQMIVTEVGGSTFTSTLLESGNGAVHFVEGWLGATSSVGITSVAYRVLDTNTGGAVQRSFEMDHLQLSPVPVPGAMLLGLLGLSVAGVKLRKRA